MKLARASAKRESPPEAVNIDDAPVGAIDAAPLLAWYDRHRRVLPWRAPAGARADPYHVWLSEIMLQQTTVKAVAPYYARFLARWPTMTALAAAPLDDVLREWAGLGYYARARNLHACAQAVAERHGGQLPADEAALRALPGIGAYTAAAVAAIAFNRVATPIDGNIERVVARLIACETPLPAAKAAIRAQAEAMTPHDRPGDFAQAMMDLGATICTPRNPACGLCPFRGPCRAQQRGDAETFPRKAPKRVGTLRRGAAFVLRRADGQVLLRTRPKRGLLGGMTEVPTTDWSPDFDVTRARQHAPQLAANGTPIRWRRIPGVVSHTFTHFPLELIVFTAEVPAGIPAPAETRWVAWEALAGEALPSVMRKVVALAQR
jgi:A/G-specific adenine glycosylase